MSGFEATQPTRFRRHVARFLALLFWIALAFCALAFAVYWTFAQFPEHDDEGYFMLTVRCLLEGLRLYDDVPVGYGPAYYAWRWLLHGVGAVPLTNDAVRVASIATWLAIAGAYALIARRTCRASGVTLAASAAAFVFAVHHLRVLTLESGHPQELCAALVALALLASAALHEPHRKLTFVLLGIAACGLLFTKVNVGVFFGLALVAALVTHMPHGAAGQTARWACGLVAALLPAVLMLPHLSEPWAQNLCAVTTAGLAASLVTLFSAPMHSGGSGDSGDRLRSFSRCLLGALLLAVALAAFVIAHGSSLAAVLQGVFITPLRLVGAFTIPSTTSRIAVAGALAAVVVSVLCARAHRSGRERALALAVPLLKLGLAGTILYGLFGPGIVLDFVTPWVFLAAIPPSTAEADERQLFTRRLIVLVYGYGVLQVYPVAGSQLATGTAPVAAVLALCLADAWTAFACGRSAALARRLRAPASAAASLAALALLLVETSRTRTFYWSGDAAEFRGCKLTRFSEEQALTLRFLVDNLRESADTFESVVGSNSLYTWTGLAPPGNLVVSHSWAMFDAAQQRRLIDDCRKHPSLVVIDHPGVVRRIERQRQPFFEYVERELRPRAGVGLYTLRLAKDRVDPPLVSCATHVRPGTSGSAGLPPALKEIAESPTRQIWRLSLPLGSPVEGITDLAVVELLTGTTVARTAAEPTLSPLWLFDRDGVVRLPLPGGPTPITVGSGDELYLALPESPALRRSGFPVVRFLDLRGVRRLSLPFAKEPTVP